MEKRLINFTTTRLDDMLHKGNVWYVRYYESYFDEVYIVYLLGDKKKILSKGNTHLISLGGGKNKLDLLIAPYRLWRLSKVIKPTSYLTADLVFSWWTSFLIRLFLKAKVVLMPVCIPHILYNSSDKTLSGLPMWLETIFIKLSFISSKRVLVSRNCGSYVEWLSNIPETKNKLKIVGTIVDFLPAPVFYNEAKKENKKIYYNSSFFKLLYVGRLHHEKLVDQLMHVVKFILNDSATTFSKPIRMFVIGDGPERKKLEILAQELGVKDNIEFLGYLPNEEVLNHYKDSDVFLSPLTGNSLREAALFGLPIVAYEMDWVVGIFKHNENILFAKPGNPKDMATQVIRLIKDQELAKRIGKNIREFILSILGGTNIKDDISRSFE